MTSLAELLDASLKSHIVAARSGDPDAQHAIHGLLTKAIRDDKLTPYMREVLTTMHESIAEGEAVDEATLTKRLSHRPVLALREGWLYLEVMAERWFADTRQPQGKRLSDEALFKIVAKRLDLSKSRVKAIYLAQRQRFEKKD